jgi:hypothetical protein
VSTHACLPIAQSNDGANADLCAQAIGTIGPMWANAHACAGKTVVMCTDAWMRHLVKAVRAVVNKCMNPPVVWPAASLPKPPTRDGTHDSLLSTALCVCTRMAPVRYH